MKRDRNIPDSNIGFYGTGLFDIDVNWYEITQHLIRPIVKFCDIERKVASPHISCRYLGYYDEMKREDIEMVIPTLRKIYNRYLPLECKTGKMFGSWENDFDRKEKLIMIESVSPELQNLHKDLLAVTKRFSIFSAVEKDNFRPHLNVAYLKKEFCKVVPREILKFVAEYKSKPFNLCFRGSYLYDMGGQVAL